MSERVNFCRLLGRNIRAIRESRNMTQGAFAERLDVSVVSVSQVENGKVWPRPRFLEKVVRQFGGSPFELFMRSEADLAGYKQVAVSSFISEMDALYPTQSKSGATFSTSHHKKRGG